MLKRIFYLDNADRFVTSRRTFDTQAACSNIDVIDRAVFIKTFRGLFGCPPSYRIVSECINDGNYLANNWPFVGKDVFANLQSACKKKLSIDPSLVRDAFCENMLHFKKHSTESVGLIDVFKDVFQTTENWDSVDAQLETNLDDWYALRKCVGAVAIVTEDEDSQDIVQMAIAMDNVCKCKAHIFTRSAFPTSCKYIVHADSIKVFPMNLFKTVSNVSFGRSLTIGQHKLQIPSVLAPLRIRTDLLKLALMDSKAFLFWNKVLKNWRDVPVEWNLKSPNAVVIFESRKNSLAVAACLATLSNVNASSWRGVVVYCNKTHTPYYEKALASVKATVFGIEEMSLDNYHIDDYNDLLKSLKLWSDLQRLGLERVLIVQDDGLLIRPGVERFLKWDYVGAPWRKGDFLLESMSNEELVGNGGLSVRNVDAMLDITARQNRKEAWPGTAAQVPEDVHFAKYVVKFGYKLCPRKEALFFSCEQVFEYNIRPCGVHKPWRYLSDDQMDYILSHDHEKGDCHYNTTDP